MPNPSKTFLYKNIKSFLKSINPKRTLDLGCGDLFIFESIKTDNYTGVDYNEEKLYRAKKKYPSANLITTNFNNFSSDIKYDLIVCLETDSINKANNSNESIQTIKNFLSYSSSGGIVILNFWSDFLLKNEKDLKEIFKIEKFLIQKELTYGFFNFSCSNLFWRITHTLMPILNFFSFFIKKKNKLFILKKIHEF